MNKKEIIKKLVSEIEELKDEKGYIQAGIPHFKGLFGRDSLIAAWQLLKYDSSIAKNTLSVLASLQGKKENIKTGEEPGKILHEYYPEDTPDKWWKEYKENIKWLQRGKPVYMSVDSTPLFLIVLGMYIEITKDFSFAEEMKDNIKNAVDWMIEYGDKDKDLFLEYEKKGPEGLFHQAWKDSDMKELNMNPPITIVEVQGYQYLALKHAAKITKKLKEKKFAEKCEKRAEELKKIFNSIFWDKDKEYFILALNENKKKVSRITSNPGHLLFTGIVTKERSRKIVEKLFTKEMFTSYGIRTYSTKEPEFSFLSYHMGTVWPHDNWITAQGLKKLGYKKEYQKIKKAFLKAYKELGFFPELYGVDNAGKILKYRDACYLQAWASGSLLNFLLDS